MRNLLLVISITAAVATIDTPSQPIELPMYRVCESLAGSDEHVPGYEYVFDYCEDTYPWVFE